MAESRPPAGFVRTPGSGKSCRWPTSSIPLDGTLARYDDAQGTDLVGTMRPLGPSGWHLVAETEHARAFAPAIAITNQIFVVDVCIVLLFKRPRLPITLAIKEPIEALSRGAQRIAEGHVDYEIPMPANDDELGLLTRHFQRHDAQARSSQLEIENDRVRLHEKNEELQRANEILAQLSITDGLTKLHNHRYFQDHLTREIKRVSRTHDPLSLILLDIDDFKLLNDTHGHAAGDEVLVALAAIMNDLARESDLIARYGGEEFVILVPNTDLAGAVHLAEKIRMTVESTRLIVGDSMKPIDITISLGVALFNGNRREFFVEADKALYAAKANGKNCVIIARSEGHRLGPLPAVPSGGARARARLPPHDRLHRTLWRDRLGQTHGLKLLAELGATIVDADALVHEMQAAGQPMLDEIRAAFGDDVIREDGSLDRPALGAIVFRDPARRKVLEKIVQPPVVAEMARRARVAIDAGEPMVVMDIPLLFEVPVGTGSAAANQYDSTVCVWVPVEVQVERTMERDGCDRAEAERRVAAQMPIDEKRERWPTT